MKQGYRALVLATTCLAFCVVIAGAYVRLADAGLGCPDWPGCYGQITPDRAQDAIARAVAEQGGEHGPVSLRKAWKEMFHRYLAGTLGLMIFVIAAIASLGRGVPRSSAAPALGLFVLVLLQAALGMWTVTLLLKPVIVTLHLIGGMATFALLVWLSARALELRLGEREPSRHHPWVIGAIAIVAVQIALGGWVSSNYAALACIDFPTCHGAWAPDMDFRHGFEVVRDLGKTAAGDHLAYEALTAIHWTHRVGALITFVYVAALAFALMRCAASRTHGGVLLIAVVVQVALGISNVLAGLPLAIAVAHNAGAALLLAVLVVIKLLLSPVSSARPRCSPH